MLMVTWQWNVKACVRLTHYPRDSYRSRTAPAQPVPGQSRRSSGSLWPSLVGMVGASAGCTAGGCSGALLLPFSVQPRTTKRRLIWAMWRPQMPTVPLHSFFRKHSSTCHQNIVTTVEVLVPASVIIITWYYHHYIITTIIVIIIIIIITGSCALKSGHVR